MFHAQRNLFLSAAVERRVGIVSLFGAHKGIKTPDSRPAFSWSFFLVPASLAGDQDKPGSTAAFESRGVSGNARRPAREQLYAVPYPASFPAF